MGRVGAALGAATDADLARALGLSTSDLANRKKRGTIPWERIVMAAVTRGVSMDSLIGRADGRSGTAEAAAGYAVRAEAYRQAVEGVLSAIERAGLRLPAVQIRRLIAFGAEHQLAPPDLDQLVAMLGSVDPLGR